MTPTLCRCTGRCPEGAVAPWGGPAVLIVSGSSFGLGFQLSGALVYRLAQGFAGFEMGDPFFGDGNTLATARIAAHTGRATIDREASKTTDLNAVTSDQGVVHRIQNRFDSKFGVTVGQLREPVSQFFHEIGSGHGMQI